MNARIAVAGGLLAALAACGDRPADEAGAAPAVPVAEVAENPPAAASPVAPAIIPPDEAADPVEPPSYEVAIASAAATRNQALARCAKQPQAVRTQCEQEANAAFADAQQDVQDLRGNKD